MSYPLPLEEIIELCEHLPEVNRREMLVSFSDNAKLCEPQEGETFVLEDIRKDEECTDTVGVYLMTKAENADQLQFRVTLGPHVQTLTRAMTAILCRGLDGSTAQEVLEVPADFVPRIVGAELVRLRSQTVYYVLTRMKSAAKVYLNRKRAENLA
jgi:cysteine desulfuration protein SufE